MASTKNFVEWTCC